MKRNMVLLGLMMVSMIVFAQRHGGYRGEKTTKRSEKMKTELKLNDDQYAKINGINEKFRADHSKLKSDTSLTVGTARKMQQKLKAEHEAQIKSVLTESQWTQWSARKTKKDEGRMRHKRGRDGKW